MNEFIAMDKRAQHLFTQARQLYNKSLELASNCLAARIPESSSELMTTYDQTSGKLYDSAIRLHSDMCTLESIGFEIECFRVRHPIPDNFVTMNNEIQKWIEEVRTQVKNVKSLADQWYLRGYEEETKESDQRILEDLDREQRAWWSDFGRYVSED